MPREVEVSLELFRVPELTSAIARGTLDGQRRMPNAQRSMKKKMPAEGLEPTRPCGHWILSPARLPIPPRRLC